METKIKLIPVIWTFACVGDTIYDGKSETEVIGVEWDVLETNECFCHRYGGNFLQKKWNQEYDTRIWILREQRETQAYREFVELGNKIYSEPRTVSMRYETRNQEPVDGFQNLSFREMLDLIKSKSKYFPSCGKLVMNSWTITAFQFGKSPESILEQWIEWDEKNPKII